MAIRQENDTSILNKIEALLASRHSPDDYESEIDSITNRWKGSQLTVKESVDNLKEIFKARSNPWKALHELVERFDGISSDVARSPKRNEEKQLDIKEEEVSNLLDRIDALGHDKRKLNERLQDLEKSQMEEKKELEDYFQKNKSLLSQLSSAKDKNEHYQKEVLKLKDELVLVKASSTASNLQPPEHHHLNSHLRASKSFQGNVDESEELQKAREQIQSLKTQVHKLNAELQLKDAFPSTRPSSSIFNSHIPGGFSHGTDFTPTQPRHASPERANPFFNDIVEMLKSHLCTAREPIRHCQEDRLLIYCFMLYPIVYGFVEDKRKVEKLVVELASEDLSLTGIRNFFLKLETPLHLQMRISFLEKKHNF